MLLIWFHVIKNKESDTKWFTVHFIWGKNCLSRKMLTSIRQRIMSIILCGSFTFYEKKLHLAHTICPAIRSQNGNKIFLLKPSFSRKSKIYQAYMYLRWFLIKESLFFWEQRLEEKNFILHFLIIFACRISSCWLFASVWN